MVIYLWNYDIRAEKPIKSLSRHCKTTTQTTVLKYLKVLKKKTQFFSKIKPDILTWNIYYFELNVCNSHFSFFWLIWVEVELSLVYSYYHFFYLLYFLGSFWDFLGNLWLFLKLGWGPISFFWSLLISTDNFHFARFLCFLIFFSFGGHFELLDHYSLFLGLVWVQKLFFGLLI